MTLPPVGFRFQAEGVQQVNAAFNQVAGRSASFSRSFVTEGGRVTAFGRQSVQALNATGFALSSLATTGTTGFRSLATSAAGFASFFGTGGLIASAVIGTGLVLTDFWNRQKREADAARESLGDLADEALARSRRDDPTQVPLIKAGQNRLLIRANQEAVAEAVARRNRIIASLQVPGERAPTQAEITKATATIDEKINQLARERAELLQKEFEARRQLNDANAKPNKTTETTATVTKTVTKSIDEEIAELIQLGQQNQLTIADLERLIALQEQFTKAVRQGTQAERAQASARLERIDKFSVPGLAVQGITETTRNRAPGPASQITLTAADQARLAPTPRELQPLTDTFSASFARALSVGLSNGVQQAIAGGGITSAFNAFGSALVSSLATINPWLGIVSGVLTGILGGIASGGRERPRGAELPIEIRRVVTDPNFRNPVQPRPGQNITVLGVNTPLGRRVLATATAGGRGRGIG